MRKPNAFNKGKALSLGLSLAVLIAATGCSKKTEVTSQKTAEQIQWEEEATALRKKKAMEDATLVQAELSKATPGQVRSLFSSCKGTILSQAKSENTSPFGVFLVDEYSADSYQGAAYAMGGNIAGEDQRVKRFMKARKAGSKDLVHELDLSYSVMFTRDSFSGPKKESKSYWCNVQPGLRVTII